MGSEDHIPSTLDYATPTLKVGGRPPFSRKDLIRFWILFFLAFVIMLAWVGYILTCKKEIIIRLGSTTTLLNPVSQWMLWISFPVSIILLAWMSRILLKYKRQLRVLALWLPIFPVLLLNLGVSFKSFSMADEYDRIQASDGKTYYSYAEYWLDGGEVGLCVESSSSLFINKRTFIAVAMVGKEQFIKTKITSHTQSAKQGEMIQDAMGIIHVCYDHRCVIHYDPKTGAAECQR